VFHLFWEPVVRPVLEAASPRVVVEVGARVGQTTERLLDLASERDFELHVIDPATGPGFDPDALKGQHGGRFNFHSRMSLDQLPLIDEIDAVILDGDHNWYTVYNELKILRGQVERGRPYPLTFVHDIGWPYGRRDLYYDPDTIPAEHRQPYAKAGITLGNGELSGTEGLNVRLYHATTEGAAHSGVRTAVEDFLSEADLPIRFLVVDGFHGLGILAWEPAVAANPTLGAALDRLESAEWLREHCRRLEEARVRTLVRLRAITRELQGRGA